MPKPPRRSSRTITTFTSTPISPAGVPSAATLTRTIPALAAATVPTTLWGSRDAKIATSESARDITMLSRWGEPVPPTGSDKPLARPGAA
ncbi:MAG TPA: hypothetical protein VMG10_10885 [Gemmataceae bacterium]|nr:hypothetical protein [Gemmataceae bacterium]